MSSFVTVAIFTFPHETAIPKAMLESEGIACYVKDEISSYMQPFFTANGIGIKLQVGSENADEAIRILKGAGYAVEEKSEGDL